MHTAEKKAHGHFVAIYGKYHVCPGISKFAIPFLDFCFLHLNYPVLGIVSVF